MSSHYDLGESKRSIRELYPVLLDAHGNVIDGFHRLEADGGWKTERLEHIKTPTQLALARIVANTHRRIVSRDERAQQIEELARALLDHDGVSKTEIVPTIAELTTFSERYVRDLLPDDYKRSYIPRGNSELSSDMDRESVQDIVVPAGTPEPSQDHQYGDNDEDSLGDEDYPPDDEVPENYVGFEEDSLLLEDEVLEEETAVDEPAPLTVQEYIGETLSVFPGAEEQWLLKVLETKFRLPKEEARKELKQYREGRRPSDKLSKHSPLSSPTCRCPLCGRQGADRNLVLTHVEDPEIAQKTLEQFITEAFRR